jgi:hypothetical protein
MGADRESPQSFSLCGGVVHCVMLIHECSLPIVGQPAVGSGRRMDCTQSFSGGFYTSIEVDDAGKARAILVRTYQSLGRIGQGAGELSLYSQLSQSGFFSVNYKIDFGKVFFGKGTCQTVAKLPALLY